MADSKVKCFKNVSKSMESFTTNFHKMVAAKAKGNFVSSALSAHVVLSMAAYGAADSTAKEMKRVLHLSDDDTLSCQEFQNFINTMNDVQQVILKLANKIFIAESFAVKDKFMDITKTYFNSESVRVNFSKNVEAANIINQWCVDKTEGKIKELFKPDQLYPDTAMVLANAVYFKGSWKQKFDKKETISAPFHINKSTTVKVPTMHIKHKFFYKQLPELKASVISLPYENEDLSMVLIVPDEIDGLDNIEKNLEKFELNDKNEHEMDKTEICLALPKFKIETTTDLNDHLKEMGMAEMFTSDANFSNISDERIRVDKVLQKAFIEVNEEGSEAAAVTGIRMARCLPRIINLSVNKPFLYKIIDGKHNVTLFSGRIINPKDNSD